MTQDIVKVGKDPKSHLRVDDELASRMHAVIEVASPEDITLIDLGNEPGTMVNGARINKCKIQPGDQIQIGGTRLILERADVCGGSVDAHDPVGRRMGHSIARRMLRRPTQPPPLPAPPQSRVCRGARCQPVCGWGSGGGGGWPSPTESVRPERVRVADDARRERTRIRS